MRTLFTRNVVVASLLLMVLLVPTTVFGQPNTGTVPGQNNTGTAGVNPAQGFELQNPLVVNTICGLIKIILNFLLSIGGPIAALFLVWAGFMFVKARGNSSELNNAKKNLVAVFVGIFIFLSAWFLGQVIANTLKSISSDTSSAGSCN